jgi:hypothetical protein
MSRGSVTRLSWQLLLALVMLLMQQAGLRHNLEHATRDDGIVNHAVCKVCLGHHATDDIVTFTPPALALLKASYSTTLTLPQAQHVSPVVTGYLSRAPPLSAC